MTALNPEQQRAVDHRDGPLLLLAGAGSGKTRVITHRIVKLIESGVPPEEILAVTFTNKAAKEMAEREAQLAPVQRSRLVVSTFHALGVRILRDHPTRFGRQPGFAIYDADDQKSLIKRLLKSEGETTTAAEVKDAIRQVARWKAQRSNGDADSLPLGVKYESELRASNAFDFDDLILKPLDLLRNDVQVRERYRTRWTRVSIDEFQDTNMAQYDLIRCLCPRGSDLLVVGDDDQSIYGWRAHVLITSLPSRKTIQTLKRYDLKETTEARSILDVSESGHCE